MVAIAVAGMLAWAGGAGRAAAQAAAKVKIGDLLIAGRSVHVVLQTTGIEIAPAAERKPGTAHHHLFLDVDVTPVDAPIPAGVKGIWHLGRGQTEFRLDSVAPGRHRLIDVLGDADHVPLKPLVADTVRFTVKP
jgi:hypothetical protein